MPNQLSFDLPARLALERDDFFVSPSNALALALIDAPQNWSNGKLILIGPKGAGKTHLAHVWAAQSGARIIDARMLDEAAVPALSQGPVVVEDADLIAGNKALETVLFHLHNLAQAEGQPLLITAQNTPQRWPLGLPDLASRLHAIQIAQLEAPDDALLTALLMKLFMDRQLNPAPDVIPFLARRIDRSFAAAQQIVATLDKATLDAKRPLTRAFASAVLDKVAPVETLLSYAEKRKGDDDAS
ncbi:HdaA/DnaA family protein [Planktotalea arctica]|uniref:HdaA/DnaA family protein n=1 Tax=Planktotalea arctica TaxID=1481893 RepID=UPI000A17423F|nr:DnaA/Hda family protein [Planktotalea arctica]